MEIAIKCSLGKLELKGEFAQIAGFLYDNEIELLPVTFDHIQHLLQLDFHHKDPFDRMLIAQALTENVCIATKDEVFNSYGVTTFWK